MNLFETLQRNVSHHGEKIVFEDDVYGDYSLSHVEEASARMYAFLSRMNIAPEDIVAIRMRRSARIFIAMLGVWRAGAAFVVIGERSPQDYVDCVLEQCKPRFILDDAAFELAMGCAPMPGWRPVQPHDLAFVEYSTGSSGVFKGSMHEFGAVQKAIDRTVVYYEFSETELEPSLCRVLFQAGFYSLHAIIVLIESVLICYYSYVLPQSAIGNNAATASALLEKRISSYSSSARDYACVKALNSPFLQEISISMDPMGSGYLPDLPCYNFYGMSESLCILSCFKLDKPYAIVPAGKPFPDMRLAVLDTADEPVGESSLEDCFRGTGRVGEVCFVPEYWRGYIAQPQLSAAAFHDGWFHTGDMAFVDKDGILSVLGRKIDMMNCDEGLIVPSIIAAAAQAAFPDMQKCHVKLFGDSAAPRIRLYYCGSAELGMAELRERLASQLPSYMLPTHCQRLDDLDYFPCGKINRLSFAEPTPDSE